MGEYDLKRLDVAIQYINRMVSGRNPVTNRPAPENEVLINANVNRCLQFVSEILTDVKSNGGIVGKPPKAAREPKAPKPSIAETFPYEILQGFRFEQDQQISYLLKQIGALFPEGESMGVQTTLITDWLRANGYLEKCHMEDISKEVTIPTEKGKEIGIYSEKAGMYPNEYYRVFYNQQAQQFLIDNFRRILTEGLVIRDKLKKERREKKEKLKAEEQAVNPGTVKASTPAGRGGNTQTRSYRGGNTQTRSYRGGNTQSRSYKGDNAQSGSYRGSYGDGRNPSTGNLYQSNNANAGAGYEEDPGFMSLLNSVPADASFDAGPVDYPYDLPQDAGAPADVYDNASLDSFFGEGWESADEGLPW